MPRTRPGSTFADRSAHPRRSASQVDTTIPRGLPRTSPITMPMVTVDVTASPSASADSDTPALARANTGTIT